MTALHTIYIYCSYFRNLSTKYQLSRLNLGKELEWEAVIWRGARHSHRLTYDVELFAFVNSIYNFMPRESYFYILFYFNLISVVPFHLDWRMHSGTKTQYFILSYTKGTTSVLFTINLQNRTWSIERNESGQCFLVGVGPIVRIAKG